MSQPMSIIEIIKEKVQEIARSRNLQDHEAFGYYFLEDHEDLSQEEAEKVILDGPWDRGRDAVYYDDENGILKIYQFKYSENPSYVEQALIDIQRGIEAEERTGRLKGKKEEIKGVDLIIVTIASINESLRKKAKKCEKSIKKWLKDRGYDIECNVELIDLARFRELFEKIRGVDVTLRWQVKNIVGGGNAIIGLLDARGLAEIIDHEELFRYKYQKVFRYT